MKLSNNYRENQPPAHQYLIMSDINLRKYYNFLAKCPAITPPAPHTLTIITLGVLVKFRN